MSRNMMDKGILTTGEVAKICGVAPRTVSKWVDGGLLPGYRIPGSKDRRVHSTVLQAFMKEYEMLVVSVPKPMANILSVSEVARIYSVSPITVVKWIDNNLLKCREIPCIKGRRIFRADLTEFANQNNLPPPE